MKTRLKIEFSDLKYLLDLHMIIRFFVPGRTVADKRLVGCWYRYWHYWVGLSINSLASIAFFLLWRKWLQIGGVGEDLPPRCYFSVLQTAELYPCSPLLSCLSPTSHPPFREKIFRPFFRFFVSECFPKSVSAPKRKPRIAERWEMKKTVVNLGHLEHLEDLIHLDQLDHLCRLGQPWSHEPLTKLL